MDYNTDVKLCYIIISRWIPPSLPTAKSPDHEKEAGSTYAAGRSRVSLTVKSMNRVILFYPHCVMLLTPPFISLISKARGSGKNAD